MPKIGSLTQGLQRKNSAAMTNGGLPLLGSKGVNYYDKAIPRDLIHKVGSACCLRFCNGSCSLTAVSS